MLINERLEDTKARLVRAISTLEEAKRMLLSLIEHIEDLENKQMGIFRTRDRE